MVKNVTLINNTDISSLRPLTDDRFIEYNYKLYSNNSRYCKKDTWWSKHLKECFENAIITSPTYICISFLYYYCIIYVVICNKQENYVLMKLDRQLKHQ